MAQGLPFSWSTACNEVANGLHKAHVSTVQNLASADSVSSFVFQLQHQHKELSEKHAFARFENIISIVKPLAAAADVLACDRPLPSTVFWGLLGLSIKVSAPRLEFIEVTLKTFESLMSVIPRFPSYIDILRKSPTLEVLIEETFKVLYNALSSLDFLRQLKWIRHQRLLEDTLRSLRKLGDAVHKEAGFELEQRSQRIAEERHNEIVTGQQIVLSALTKSLGTIKMEDNAKFIVPHPPNPSFTNREGEMKQIHTALTTDECNEPLYQKVVAICGLGGVGKSQLALKYAYEYRQCYSACFWITCDSAVKMDGDLAYIVEKLGYPNLGLHQNRQRLKDWSARTGEMFLLIFDNAENIEGISDFWPRSSKGSIILTSQNSSWLLKENVSHGISLKSLTESASLELLRKTIKKQQKHIQPDAAVAIVKETGGLPLAIRHIGSYICAMETDPTDFMKDYEDEREAVKIDAWDESTPPWYSHTLSTFLNFAFERLTPDAVSLLSVVIFLDAEAINENIFLPHDNSREPLISRSRYNLAVRNCIQYDFLSRARIDGGNTLSIHRQVRKYLGHRLTQEQVQEGFKYAFSCLRCLFPHQSAIAEPLSNQWPQCAQWIEHLIAFSDGMLRFMHVLDPPVQVAPLLVDGAIYLWERGLLDEGRKLTLAAKRIVEHGDCDERILAEVYSFHACILSESGDLPEAKLYFEKQVAKRKETLQKTKSERKPRNKYDEVQLANAYNNLAGVSCALGLFDDARLYNEMSLRIKKHWANQLDLRYLLSLSYQNMATLYGQTGRYQEAVTCFEEALRLGENTNYTLRWALTFHNYGCMEFARGNATDARQHFERAYELRQASLGDHYDTATTLHMLASCYQGQGDIPSMLMARDLLVEAIRILESGSCRVDPRRIARSKFKLSMVLLELGDQDANSLQAEVREILVDVGGTSASEEALDALVSYV